MTLGDSAGEVGQQGTNLGHVHVGYGRRQYRLFGHIGTKVGQQGTNCNSGNVGVGNGYGYRYGRK